MIRNYIKNWKPRCLFVKIVIKVILDWRFFFFNGICVSTQSICAFAYRRELHFYYFATSKFKIVINTIAIIFVFVQKKIGICICICNWHIISRCWSCMLYFLFSLIHFLKHKPHSFLRKGIQTLLEELVPPLIIYDALSLVCTRPNFTALII